MEQTRIKNHTNKIYLVIAIFSIVFIGFNINYKYIGYDEVFTLQLIKDSYSQIWEVTSDDVHPPLYYWMLKTFCSIFGHSVLVARIFSAIPVFLCVFLGYTHIRKLWGDRIAIFFMVLMILHPSIHFPMGEIRMYSWSMFFCLFTFIYAYQFYNNLKNKDLILFIFYSLCSAYTHYYALLTTVGIFAWLLAILYVNKRNKLHLFFIASLFCIIGYIPWLIFMFKQVAAVTDNYWIKDFIGFSEIIDTIFPFVKMKITGVILTLLLIICIALSLQKDKEAKTKIKQGLIMLLIASFPIIVGIAYSLAIRPVFMIRYMCPAIPIFILGIAILLSTINLEKRITLSLIIIFFGFITYESIRLTKKETQRRIITEKEKNDFEAFISERIDANTIFLHHYASNREIPYWIEKYPQQLHIARIIPLPARDQILEYIPHEKINSFEELLESHQNIFFECKNDKPFATTEGDSISLMKNYIISDQISSKDHTLYQLQRRKRQ